MESNVQVTRKSLLDCLAEIPDPRKARGIRHPMPAVLGLICCATISGARGFRAIAQWGRQHHQQIGMLLGFKRRPPCHSSYHYMLADLDIAAFEAVLTNWMREQGIEAGTMAIDGKTLRGSRDGDVPGVHLLSAFAAEKGGVVAQLKVETKTNEAKAALELLGLIPLKEKVVTMDAMFTQRDICEQIHDAEGDYVVQVKGNQATLKEHIQDAFDPGISPLATAAV